MIGFELDFGRRMIRSRGRVIDCGSVHIYKQKRAHKLENLFDIMNRITPYSASRVIKKIKERLIIEN